MGQKNMGQNNKIEFRKTTNPLERMGIGIANPKLKAIALQVFGTRDGESPMFPRNGERIQEAMEQAYQLGKRKGLSGRE